MLPNVKQLGSDSDSLLKIDYQSVVLRLIYAQMQDKSFHLILGLAEFVPFEYTAPDAWPIDPSSRSLGVFKYGSQRVFYRRFVMAVEEFGKWWSSAGAGDLHIPQAPSHVILKTEQLTHEPSITGWTLTSRWPYFVNTNSGLSEILQYRTQYWAASNTTESNSELEILLRHETVSVGLKKIMGNSFDQLKAPWLGSLHAMAPNPLYRSISTTLYESRSDEWLRIQIVPRSQCDTSTLRLLINEHRPTGLGSTHLEKIEHNNFLLKRSGALDQISVAVFCTDRGILEAHTSMSFLRQINLKFGIDSKELHIPITAQDGILKQTLVQKLVKYTASNIGEADPFKRALLTTLHTSLRERKKKNLANQIGQKLFYEQHTEAVNFLGEKIQAANASVRLIDPYLSIEDFFRFSTFAQSEDISYEAVTSGKFILQVEKEQNKKGVMPEFLLSQQLQSHVQKNYGSHFTRPIKVSVLGGKSSPIHDRFLIVDDMVWHLGGSFNSIGKSASVVCQMADPQPILARLDAIIEKRSLPLADWVRVRSQTGNTK